MPATAPVESEGREGGPWDRHVVVVQRDPSQPNCLGKLFELYDARRSGLGWTAANGAVFDLNSNRLRPAGWTSADAAGLPILPGLARYHDVKRGVIDHALRFTVQRTRRAYVFPARHYASNTDDASLPPMGLRVRLKAGYDTSRFSPHARIVAEALKRYGMILADNGSPWYISGTSDPRFDDDVLHELDVITGRNLEVVDTTGLVNGP